MIALRDTPLFAVALTLAAYALGEWLYARTRSVALHPVLTASVLVALVLRLAGVPVARYAERAQMVGFFLGPAVVALGLPLWKQSRQVARQWRALLVSLGAGSVAGVASAVLVAKWLGASREVLASLAPKSVTTPIAMAIAERLGGVPALTSGVVISVGIFGAVVGPPWLRLLRVKSPSAWGLAMGAAAHAVGTSRAMEEGELQGAASALAIGLHGVATALVAPWLLRWLG